MLGSKDYLIVEEGQPGRTTVHDDPIEGEKNGLTYLLPCLESHHPDLVIILLGTNDLKARFNLSAEDVSRGAARLVETVQKFHHYMMKKPPAVLLVAPPPIKEIGYFADMFAGGEEKSLNLGKHFFDRAKELGCDFMDSKGLIESCSKEGIHWQLRSHHIYCCNRASSVSQFVLARCLPSNIRL